jgi:hypothetical protein
MQMPGRVYNGGAYRFGYNGQEKDNEVYGTGNLNTAEHWEYDTRTGRRWNVDPIVKDDQSSYSCFDGNPILLSDPNGDDTKDKIAGIVIGALTDVFSIVPGSGEGIRNLYPPTDAADYNNALQGTDNVMSAAGIVMQAHGIATIGVGVTTMGAGGAAVLTGVGAPAGAAAITAGGIVTAEGGIETGAGGLLQTSVNNNQKAGYNYGEKKPAQSQANSEQTKANTQSQAQKVNSNQKPSLSGTKKALKEAKAKIGLEPNETLPKGEQGKFGSPQRGNSVKGYRLDPAHPNAKPGSGETTNHINYWDYSKAKRGNGCIKGTILIN